MPQHLTLSRAARLIGVRRGALQRKIRSGELATFEGMVSAADLQRAYPQASLEDDSGLERIEKIKDAAFARRLRERLLPNAEALAARLTAMSTERAQIEARLEHYRAIVGELQGKLRALGESGSPRAAAAGLLEWLDRSLDPAPQRVELRPLRMQQDFLRIMTAHVQIKPSGHEGETARHCACAPPPCSSCRAAPRTRQTVRAACARD